MGKAQSSRVRRRTSRGGGSRSGLLIPVALVTALVGTACTQIVERAVQQNSSNPEPAAVHQKPCTAASVRSCGLPYPSDEFVVADPNSPTGIRLEVPDEIVPEGVRNSLGPGAGIRDAFGGADGYSALSPVIFEVDHPVRPESLPADGGDVLVVHDSTTGQRQEIRAHVWLDAAYRGAPATIVMAWPAVRWEYGHTYVARLGRLAGFLPVAPRPPAAVRDGTGHLAGVLDRLAAVDPVPRERILSVTEFTVGSREDATGDLERMAWIAGADDHPVRNLESRPPAFFSDGAAIITGEVRITDFRDGDGVVHADRPPGHGWVPFVLAVPEEPASDAGAPVVVYGHGLVINKESMLVVASQNAAKGVATIGIDMPNHGGRQAGQGGFLLDLAYPRKLGRMVGVPPQGIVDHVSLVRAIVGHMGDVDLSPWRIDGPPGDGLPDLDTSVLLYEGTSMGGVLGAAEFALIPDLDAAFLQVPGAGILDILTHSSLWPLFAPLIPGGATAGDAAAMVGAASMLIDRGDPTHLLDGLRESGRPVVAQIGIGDSIVPEFAADRLVRMLDLPRIGEARTGISASSGTDTLAPDGRGFIEVWPQSSSPQTMGLMGHITFEEPMALAMLAEWLDQRLAAAGIAPSK